MNAADSPLMRSSRREHVPTLGIDLHARPPLAEVLEARGTRMTMVRGIVDALTDDDLGRITPRPKRLHGRSVTGWPRSRRIAIG